MMTFDKASAAEPQPALSRLLSDSALSRAALGACGIPLALIDATAPSRPVTYANPAFEHFFGFAPGQALGRSLGELVLNGDDSTVHRLMAETSCRRDLCVWRTDGVARNVELSLGAIRSADGRITHWIAGFSDRTELERLRAELECLKSVAAA